MMTTRTVRSLAACAALVMVAWTVTAAAQTAPVPENAAKLKGSWRLNRDKSTIPPVPVGLIPPPPGRGDQGKKGGLTGGVGGGGGGDQQTPETAGQSTAKAALREVQPPQETIIINFSATDVTLMTVDGTIRRFNTDGKSQNLQLGEWRVMTKTSWQPNGALTQELVGGPLKLFRRWAVSDDGTLIATVRAEGGTDRQPPAPMMMIYEKK